MKTSQVRAAVLALGLGTPRRRSKTSSRNTVKSCSPEPPFFLWFDQRNRASENEGRRFRAEDIFKRADCGRQPPTGK
jgi:hypothetical protein